MLFRSGCGVSQECCKAPCGRVGGAAKGALGAMATEVLCNKRSHHSEKPQHGNEEESPLTTTREGPRSSEDPAQPNIKKKKKYWTPRTRWCIHSRVEETQGITGSFPSPLFLHLTHKPTPWLHPECGDNKREGGWVLPGRYRAWASVNPRRGGETFRMLQGGKHPPICSVSRLVSFQLKAFTMP